jgi:hypothetical protein
MSRNLTPSNYPIPPDPIGLTQVTPERVYVYRPNEELLVLENPQVVSGDPLLPGFVLEMQRLW